MAFPDHAIFKDGTGRFRDASHQWGLKAAGRASALSRPHLDGDDSIDLYVANDTVENALYLNKRSTASRGRTPPRCRC
jgi:hypothetical protein